LKSTAGGGSDGSLERVRDFKTREEPKDGAKAWTLCGVYVTLFLLGLGRLASGRLTRAAMDRMGARSGPRLCMLHHVHGGCAGRRLVQRTTAARGTTPEHAAAHPLVPASAQASSARVNYSHRSSDRQETQHHGKMAAEKASCCAPRLTLARRATSYPRGWAGQGQDELAASAAASMVCCAVQVPVGSLFLSVPREAGSPASLRARLSSWGSAQTVSINICAPMLVARPEPTPAVVPHNPPKLTTQTNYLTSYTGDYIQCWPSW
jgi:hypothetical protein